MAPVAPFALTGEAANRGRVPATAIGLGLLFLASCVSPLQAPSAFAGERYLCDDKGASEWEARIQDCRATDPLDGPCHGVISFRGVIDAQSVVVDSPVTRLIITDAPKNDGTVSRDLFLYGLSPYFRFSFDFPGFSDPGHSRSGFVVQSGACVQDFVTPCFAGVMNLEVRGGTLLTELSTLLQNVKIDTPEELRVTFSADLVVGGELTGCFDLNLAAQP